MRNSFVLWSWGNCSVSVQEIFSRHSLHLQIYWLLLAAVQSNENSFELIMTLQFDIDSKIEIV